MLLTQQLSSGMLSLLAVEKAPMFLIKEMSQDPYIGELLLAIHTVGVSNIAFNDLKILSRAHCNVYSTSISIPSCILIPNSQHLSPWTLPSKLDS